MKITVETDKKAGCNSTQKEKRIPNLSSKAKAELFKADKLKKKNSIHTKNGKIEFSKKIVLFVTINAELQIWASYFLGYLGKEKIAESLSITVVKTVIYVVICYLVRALVEGLSKNTTMFGQNLPFPNASSISSIEDIDYSDYVDEVDENTTELNEEGVG